MVSDLNLSSKNSYAKNVSSSDRTLLSHFRADINIYFQHFSNSMYTFIQKFGVLKKRESF